MHTNMLHTCMHTCTCVVCAHETEGEAEEEHVCEVEEGLEEACHLGLHEEVVDGVEKDIARPASGLGLGLGYTSGCGFRFT